MLTIHCLEHDVLMEASEKHVLRFPLSLRHVYDLESVFESMQQAGALDEGMEIVSSIPCSYPPPLARSELFFQILEHATTYYLYPRLSDKSPHRVGHCREDFEHHLHSIENLALHATLCSCQVLAGREAGGVMGIVSPGPSIDFQRLRDWKGRIPILAVGRVLPRLLEQGVTPDYIYMQDTSSHSWSETFGGVEDTPLDAVLVANPVGPIARHAHRVRHVYKAWNYYHDELDKMPTLVNIAPSSTSGAYSLAMLLGARTFLFMGCDSGRLLAPGEEVDDAWDLTRIILDGNAPAAMFAALSCFTLRTQAGTVLTKSDYISSAQWLKRQFFQDVFKGFAFHDNAPAGMLRANGIATPFPENPPMPGVNAAPLPSYDPRFDAVSRRRQLKQRYRFLHRSLSRGSETPPLALEQPYNSIFTDLPHYGPGLRDLDEADRRKALSRLETLLHALDA